MEGKSAPIACEVETDDLAKGFELVAPPGVSIDVRRISDQWIEKLFPSEREVAAGFATKRLAEFATGRASLRKLIAEKGLAACSVPIGERRAPVLPAGLRASITHCETFVASAAARDDLLAGLGVDLEVRKRITPDLANVVLSSTEKERRASRRDNAELAFVFSGKEAAFKAIHGIIGQYIDFTDLALSFAGEEFIVDPLIDHHGLKRVRVEGRCTYLDRFVLACCWAKKIEAGSSAELA